MQYISISLTLQFGSRFRLYHFWFGQFRKRSIDVCCFFCLLSSHHHRKESAVVLLQLHQKCRKISRKFKQTAGVFDPPLRNVEAKQSKSKVKRKHHCTWNPHYEHSESERSSPFPWQQNSVYHFPGERPHPMNRQSFLFLRPLPSHRPIKFV